MKTTKDAVLMTLTFGKAFDDQVRQRAEIVAITSTKDFPKLPREDLARIRAVLTTGTESFSSELLDLMPKLGLISCFGSGFDQIDVPLMHARGIHVTHSPDANAASVADQAIALLLASTRYTVRAHNYTAASKWTSFEALGTEFPMARGLTGRRIGVLGLGAIGRKIADRLIAFETEVGYHNRNQKDAPYRYFPTLMEMAEWADVLMVAHRADESNRHIVNADVLKALGPTGHVVNIARGVAIDEDALIEALKNGTIAGAGLDVFHNEPNIRRDLLAAPNIVVAPHIGGGTQEAFTAMARMVLNNLDTYLSTGKAVNPVPM
jgi:hydroxypyruvate reductase